VLLTGGAPGAMVGPYHLIEKLGHGGMGEVWLAEQQAPVRRRVAVKLIRAGMDSRDVIARFESERQALALMDHPAIATVLDAGTAAGGLPYFVMEYVPGPPITEYCDKHRLSVRERLKLFIRVCEGVQHAHQKAIIHRDLKPSNILVAEVDGKPAPKIIDFGIAKATSQKLTPVTMLTRMGALVGTPEYMSPEQVDPGSEDIDTRTDVYSLGVVLYELLVGIVPVKLDDLKSLPLHELLRRIREDDAPRPSLRMRTLGDTSNAAARNRRSEASTITRQLRGDLDAIALKALEKDRSRRYGSPAELASDIQRYLRNEPVLATEPSLVYKARKFARRHVAAVAAGSAIAVALIALVVTLAISSVRVAHERDRANREAETSKKIAAFLTSLFQVSDPSEARGSAVTAREILDRGAAQIEKDLAAEPEVRAGLMATISDVYTGLGLYRPAEQLARKSLDTRRRLLGPDHPDTLKSQFLTAVAADRQGRYPESEKLLRETLEAQRKVLGGEHPDTLKTASRLGMVHYLQGRYEEANKELSTLLEVSRRVLGIDHPQTLTALSNLGLTLDGLHQFDKEEAVWRELMNERKLVLGPNHPDTFLAMQNLAHTQMRLGKYAEAEKLQREALDIGRRLLGPDHRNVLIAMNTLADILQMQRRFDEAERIQRDVLAARLRTLGLDHPETYFAMNNVAGVLQSRGRYAEAETFYRKALAGERRVLGDDHAEVGYVYYGLAAVASAQGRRSDAISMLGEAVKRGYSDISEILAEPLFQPLAADTEYRALLEQIRKRDAAMGGE
jgi:non-specific serine/threonine protein kinase/serine/threonine-protein kinase